MKNGKKIFWGFLFLLAAVAVIASGLGYFEGFSFWTILFTIVLIGLLVEGICHRSFGSILFALAFLAILYDKQLGLEDITPWPVLGAALLGTIGLGILFPNVSVKHYMKHGKRVSCQNSAGENLDTDNVHLEVSFGESVKYLTSKELSLAHLECSFGSMNVYFDNAQLLDGEAEVHAECSFGNMVLYVPADWKVVVNVSTAFGGVDEHGRCNQAGNNTLYIRGEVSFGALEIHYI